MKLHQHLGTLTDKELCDFAHMAFSFGLSDGRTRSKPIDSEALMHRLFPVGWNGLKVHRWKLRQVYGAGYDIARAIRRKRFTDEDLEWMKEEEKQ